MADEKATKGAPPAKAAPKAPSRKWKYIGPDQEAITWPRYRLTFRPGMATDNQIEAILARYPKLEKYFEKV